MKKNRTYAIERLFKILVVMKFTAFLLLLSISVLNASVYSQTAKFSLTKNNITVREAFKEIEKQSLYSFLYNDDYLDLNKIISVQIINKKINEILDLLFAETDLTYKILDNNLIILAPKKNFSVRVTGEVVSSTDHAPIPGVTILEKGTNNGTMTDMDGRYSIDVEGTGSVLIFSAIGFETQEIPVEMKTSIDIKMNEKIEDVEEVVVIGYGTAKKSDLTGAISQVKSDEMENRTITNATQALQGKTAGVQIIQTSGAPGKEAVIRIRGYSSNSSSDPLYVVDGLRTSNISGIDPNNIESIEILKDAASAAIYGAQAGNGVVLITTKKGKKGEGKIIYDFQYVINSLARNPKVMNAQQYMNYVTEANFITQDFIDANYDGTTDTDWSDVTFENSIMKKHNISFMGGNERGTYNLSLSYLDQDGIVKGNKDVYNRITAMINADYNIKKWLKIGTNNIIESWKSKSVSENSEYGSLLASVMTMDPLTPAYYSPDELPDYMQTFIDGGNTLLTNEDGDYYAISQFFIAEQVHPFIMRDRTDAESKGANILGTLYAEISPFKGFVFTSKLGYRAAYTSNYSFTKIYYGNSIVNSSNIDLSRTNSTSLYYQWENFANYNLVLNKHNLTALLGISYSAPYSNYVKAGGNALYKNDESFQDVAYIAPDASKTVDGGYSDFGRQFSYFGRVAYNYNDKYMIQASVRRDANDLSALPKENRWGTFPAVSAGYTISNEDFFPKNIPINNLKLRASWGQNGSIGPLGGFMYTDDISSNNFYPFTSSVAYQVASISSKVLNNNLVWETSEQLDFGIDLSAFNNRLTFNVDYFEKKTKDLLISVTPPYESGVDSYTLNAGSISNKGFEIELGWTQSVKDLKFSVHGNIATLSNKVTYLTPDVSRISGADFHINYGVTAFEQGLPVWYMRGYRMTDIDDISGDPIFEDQLTVDSNGDGILDKADGIINDADKVMIGSGIPDFTYGITLTAAFKGFDLLVFGTGSQGNEIFSALTRVDRPTGNKLALYYENRWTPSNTTASMPRPNANGEDKFWISSANVMDGSYFKIKQIQLGYSLPQNLLKRIYLGNVRAYISLDDWFVFTNYPGFDPEASAGANEFLGIDKGSYPNSRKVVFGINVTF